MPRIITVGAAQLGPIAKVETRGQVVRRLIALLREAKGHGCDLVVFPELALTTFFPRWYFADQAEVDCYFEREMPSAETRPLFDEAEQLGIGFQLGYAELVEQDGRLRRFNTAILVDKTGHMSVNTARCICRVMPSTNLGGNSSIWRSAISRLATWAFQCFARSAASSACAFAMTAAGRRPIASWACKASR